MAKEIRKDQQGVRVCEPFGEGQVCVTGHKYGYSAWIVDRNGRELAPLAVGKPPTARQALRIVSAKARRIAAHGAEREIRQRRGPRPRPEGER